MNDHFKIIRRDSPQMQRVYEEQRAAVIENLCALMGLVDSVERSLIVEKFEKMKHHGDTVGRQDDLLRSIRDRLQAKRRSPGDDTVHRRLDGKNVVDLL